MSNQSQPSVFDLADKIALELVFAEVGKDSGLLPINSLLTEMESHPGNSTLPEPLRRALGLARPWVDRALEAGALDADGIKELSVWSTWLREANAALEQGQLLPAPLEFSGVVAAAGAPSLSPPPAAIPPEDEEMVLDVANNGELLREFIGEAQEHLNRVEVDALALEKDPADADTLNSVFRSFHTLKGGSGFLNLLPMSRLAHELEALLDLARQGKIKAHSGFIDVILAGRDTLRRFVSEIERRLAGETPGEPIRVSTHSLLARVHAAQTESAEAPAPSAPGAVTSPAGAIPASAAAGAATTGEDARSGGNGFVKVDTGKLDSLIDLVGELVIAQSLVVQDADLRSLQSQQLSRNLVHLGRITNDLQHIAMSLRMVPIRATFQKMTRLVRDVASKAGKLVELQVSGEEVELDRNLIELINDPLIHMLRNAVDHGVEKPDQRESRGKPGKGVVKLRASHQGGNVVLEISDDGAGLSKDRILARGLEMGLIDKAVQPTEQEIFGLIFVPGFSTAEKVTEISGRGVGMDVVRRNINKLRGKIEVHSTPGKGSTFSIHLPLTLAIIDGLIFSIGRERFIVPTLCVCESFRPQPGMISTVQGRGEMVKVRGQFNPLIRLYDRFGLQPDTTDPSQAIIIVVETNRNRCGLMVDRLLGKQEVVIKGLGDAFKQSRALAGAAILGDGRVGLILDVNGLVRAGTASLAGN